MRAHRLGPPGTATRPATLRLARRGARLAAGLRLPLVSLIDTAGAELSARPEEDGLAGEIAGWPASTTTLPVLLGQEPAARRWPCCPPTASWPPSTPGPPR